MPELGYRSIKGSKGAHYIAPSGEVVSRYRYEKARAESSVYGSLKEWQEARTSENFQRLGRAAGFKRFTPTMRFSEAYGQAVQQSGGTYANPDRISSRSSYGFFLKEYDIWDADRQNWPDT